MNNKQFISNLSATYADIRKLDVKKINLKGKNILEYIKENTTVILDERGTLANDELDVWNSYIIKDENGNVIINRNAKPKEHRSIKTNNDANDYAKYEGITESQANVIKTAVKVIDNEVLGSNNEHIMYWQTDGLISGFWMFSYNRKLESFSSDLSSLTDGEQMFRDCNKLTSFKGNLSSLTDGEQMFWDCNNLNSFTSDLSNLTIGSDMFDSCSNLTSFASDSSGSPVNLSSLTYGSSMFRYCSNLTSFSSDLSSLTYGRYMFYKSGLETFSSDLSSLTDGQNMFYNCKLDAPSVANIIHFIPQMDAKPTSQWDNGNIAIGIDIANTEEAKQAFAEELDCVDWADLNKEFDDKNWAVVWQFNGSASYSLRDPRPSTAVFARLEEVIMPTDEKAHKPHYQYTSQDGSKFYNIHWYHDSNTNNEGYDYFESLEEAIAAYGVITK